MLAKAAFGSGLNIHSKWFCLANHVATSSGMKSKTRHTLRHQGRAPFHSEIPITIASASNDRVMTGDQWRNAYDNFNRSGVCNLNGWISNAGTNTAAKASSVTPRRSTQRTQGRLSTFADGSLCTQSPFSCSVKRLNDTRFVIPHSTYVKRFV